MVNMLRTRAVWQGFTGAPGYTNWFWDYSSGTQVGASGALASLQDFFVAIKALLPADVTISYEQDCAIVDSTTGQQIGQVSADPQPATTGSGVGVYASPSGAMVRWTNDTYRKGRQVRGRTFIVPCIYSIYDGTGSLTPAAITTISTAANGSISTGGLPRGIFSRPPTGGGTGAFTPITGFTVPDLAVVLRSRRD